MLRKSKSTKIPGTASTSSILRRKINKSETQTGSLNADMHLKLTRDCLSVTNVSS